MNIPSNLSVFQMMVVRCKSGCVTEQKSARWIQRMVIYLFKITLLGIFQVHAQVKSPWTKNIKDAEATKVKELGEGEGIEIEAIWYRCFIQPIELYKVFKIANLVSGGDD